MRKLFALLVLQQFAFADPRVVHLVPPVLSSDTILDEIGCTRPMREGKFNISTEMKNNKRIVHCYGHGGSGWTTLGGSVAKAIRLFEQTPDLSKEKPIRVIGAGCMGLTTAVELKRKGYNVLGITAKELINLPSWRGTGYLAIVSVKTSPEEQQDLNEIGIETFKNYQSMDRGEHPYHSKECVRMLPVYCSKDTESGLDALEKPSRHIGNTHPVFVAELESKGLIPPHEDVTIEFEGGARHEDFVEYKTYFMNTPKLMNELYAEVDRLGIPITQGEVQSFDEIEEPVIFNCSGLGAKLLNEDPAMVAVRGHLLLLNEKAGDAHMNYMIYTKVEQDGEERYVYMFPKPLSVTTEHPGGRKAWSALGGTFIPNTDRLTKEELAELDRVEFQKLKDRNAMFFYGKPYTQE